MKAFLLFSTWQGGNKGRWQKGWGKGEIIIILYIPVKGDDYSREMINWGMIIVRGLRPCIRFFYLLQVRWLNESKLFVLEIAFLVFHGRLHNMENNTWNLWIRFLIFLYSSQYLTHLLHSLMRHRLEHLKIKFGIMCSLRTPRPIC